LQQPHLSLNLADPVATTEAAASAAAVRIVVLRPRTAVAVVIRVAADHPIVFNVLALNI